MRKSETLVDNDLYPIIQFARLAVEHMVVDQTLTPQDPLSKRFENNSTILFNCLLAFLFLIEHLQLPANPNQIQIPKIAP